MLRDAFVAILICWSAHAAVGVFFLFHNCDYSTCFTDRHLQHRHIVLVVYLWFALQWRQQHWHRQLEVVRFTIRLAHLLVVQRIIRVLIDCWLLKTVSRNELVCSKRFCRHYAVLKRCRVVLPGTPVYVTDNNSLCTIYNRIMHQHLSCLEMQLPVRYRWIRQIPHRSSTLPATMLFINYRHRFRLCPAVD